MIKRVSIFISVFILFIMSGVSVFSNEHAHWLDPNGKDKVSHVYNPDYIECTGSSCIYIEEYVNSEFILNVLVYDKNKGAPGELVVYPVEVVLTWDVLTGGAGLVDQTNDGNAEFNIERFAFDVKYSATVNSVVDSGVRVSADAIASGDNILKDFVIDWINSDITVDEHYNVIYNSEKEIEVPFEYAYVVRNGKALNTSVVGSVDSDSGYGGFRDVIEISANDAPVNQEFAGWRVTSTSPEFDMRDLVGFDFYNTDTSFTMPSYPIVITATYRHITPPPVVVTPSPTIKPSIKPSVKPSIKPFVPEEILYKVTDPTVESLPYDRDFDDDDNDGLNNSLETALGTKKDSNDSDNDGISDYDEVVNGTNPLNPDSPGNKDSNNDGVLDKDDILNKPIIDSDNDGLSDLLENEYATDSSNPDTDGDGFSDFQEFIYGTKPTDKNHFPGSPAGDGYYTGTGLYQDGEIVTLTLRDIPKGKKFDRWVGLGDIILLSGDINSKTISFKMTNYNLGVYPIFVDDDSNILLNNTLLTNKFVPNGFLESIMGSGHYHGSWCVLGLHEFFTNEHSILLCWIIPIMIIINILLLVIRLLRAIDREELYDIVYDRLMNDY